MHLKRRTLSSPFFVSCCLLECETFRMNSCIVKQEKVVATPRQSVGGRRQLGINPAAVDSRSATTHGLRDRGYPAIYVFSTV